MYFSINKEFLFLVTVSSQAPYWCFGNQCLKWQLHPNSQGTGFYFPRYTEQMKLFLQTCCSIIIFTAVILFLTVQAKSKCRIYPLKICLWLFTKPRELELCIFETATSKPGRAAFLPCICETQSSANMIFNSCFWFRISTSEYTAINL